MSYLSELTAHERLTVDNATLDMFTAFENGSDLIYDIWEQYFSDSLVVLPGLGNCGRLFSAVALTLPSPDASLPILDRLSFPLHPAVCSVVIKEVCCVYAVFPFDTVSLYFLKSRRNKASAWRRSRLIIYLFSFLIYPYLCIRFGYILYTLRIHMTIPSIFSDR